MSSCSHCPPHTPPSLPLVSRLCLFRYLFFVPCAVFAESHLAPTSRPPPHYHPPQLRPHTPLLYIFVTWLCSSKLKDCARREKRRSPKENKEQNREPCRPPPPFSLHRARRRCCRCSEQTVFFLTRNDDKPCYYLDIAPIPIRCRLVRCVVNNRPNLTPLLAILPVDTHTHSLT